MLTIKITLQILAVMIAMLVNILDYVNHDKRTAKFKFSRKWLFILSGIFLIGSVIFTVWEDTNNKTKENELKSQLEKVQSQNNELQNDINRVAKPINDVTVSFQLSVSLNTQSGIAYRKRINDAISELSKQSEGLWKMGVVMGTEGNVQRINIDKPSHIPDKDKETTVYVAIGVVPLIIDFYKNSVSLDTLLIKPDNPDLRISVLGSLDKDIQKQANPTWNSGMSLVYELSERYFTISAGNLIPSSVRQINNGMITAIPDLAGTQMVVWLPSVPTTDPNITSEIKKIYESVELKSLSIRMSGGREFKFSQTDLQRHSDNDGDNFYTVQFPKIL